jgi:hypothetical protein
MVVVSFGLCCRVVTTLLTDRDNRFIKYAKDYYGYRLIAVMRGGRVKSLEMTDPNSAALVIFYFRKMRLPGKQ